MPIRTYVSDFSLKNPFYAGATCAIYEVNENLQKTATLATLYANPTGPTLRANPMVLDSEGKFPNLPIYAEKPILIEVTPVASAAVDLGVQGLVSRWRGVWASGTLYYPGERVRDPAGPTTYVVLTGHVSATFLTDVGNGLIEEDIDGDSIAAAAAASLFGTVLPDTPAEAYYRVNPAGTAVETRTPTQVRADIGAFAAAGGNITGAVGMPDGAATAPAVSFSADTNTGLYRIGADIIGVAAGGAERLRASNIAITAQVPVVLAAGDPSADNQAARKGYVDSGDRLVSIVSQAITGSNLIDVSLPTSGYAAFLIKFFGVRSVSTSGSVDFYFRVKQAGVIKSGSADYFLQGPTWDGGTGAVVNGTASIGSLFGSTSGEPIIVDAVFWPGFGTGTDNRGLMSNKSFGFTTSGNRYSFSLNTQVLVTDAQTDGIVFGWTGGANFAATGRLLILGVKS